MPEYWSVWRKIVVLVQTAVPKYRLGDLNKKTFFQFQRLGNPRLR